MSIAGFIQLVLFVAVAGAVVYFVVLPLLKKDGDKFDL